MLTVSTGPRGEPRIRTLGSLLFFHGEGGHRAGIIDLNRKS